MEAISVNQQIHVVEDQLVSVSSESESSIFVHPTSFTGTFVVSADSEISRITVVDGSGRSILFKDLINSRSILVEMTTQPAGIYTVTVHMKNGERISQKVIKG